MRREYASALVLLDDRISMSPLVATPLAAAGDNTFATSHPGQFAVAQVEIPGTIHELLVISLYGLWHSVSGNGAEATLHRALSDLTALFLTSPHVVLAGDLNVFRNTTNVGQRRFDTVFTRLDAYDLHLVGPLLPAGHPRLVGCTCGQGDECDHVETFRLFRTGALPYQDDFVFAKAITTESCVALADPLIRSARLSDHWPVVARFEL
jgi:hypothetical protein